MNDGLSVLSDPNRSVLLSPEEDYSWDTPLDDPEVTDMEVSGVGCSPIFAPVSLVPPDLSDSRSDAENEYDHLKEAAAGMHDALQRVSSHLPPDKAIVGWLMCRNEQLPVARSVSYTVWKDGHALIGDYSELHWQQLLDRGEAYEGEYKPNQEKP